MVQCAPRSSNGPDHLGLCAPLQCSIAVLEQAFNNYVVEMPIREQMIYAEWVRSRWEYWLQCQKQGTASDQLASLKAREGGFVDEALKDNKASRKDKKEAKEQFKRFVCKSEAMLQHNLQKTVQYRRWVTEHLSWEDDLARQIKGEAALSGAAGSMPFRFESGHLEEESDTRLKRLNYVNNWQAGFAKDARACCNCRNFGARVVACSAFFQALLADVAHMRLQFQRTRLLWGHWPSKKVSGRDGSVLWTKMQRCATAMDESGQAAHPLAPIINTYAHQIAFEEPVEDEKVDQVRHCSATEHVLEQSCSREYPSGLQLCAPSHPPSPHRPRSRVPALVAERRWSRCCRSGWKTPRPG